MKKKLNLLWNLKFNFFSVAERPLTFFAYFLNAKKVGRRRLVIGPRKRGPSSFPTRGFRSRPGPCSRSVAFRLRRNRAGRSSAPQGPTFCRSRHGCAAPGPQRQNPGPCSRSVAFRLRRNRAGRSSAPQGPTFCRSRHGCAAPGPQRQNPGPCSRSVAFRLRRNRAGRSLPPPGATCSLPHFRFAQMWPRARTPALPPFRLRTSSFSAHFSAQKCPCRAMLSHSSRRGRPFALFHRAGAAFGTLTAAAAPPPSWSRRPLHIPCPPF